MDTRTNKFYVSEKPKEADHISFEVGEEVELKGHIFAVELVDIPKNPTKPHLLVLRPIRPATP